MIRRILIASILMIVLFIAMAWASLNIWPNRPLSSNSQVSIYILPKGASVNAMAHQLERAGIISSLQRFLLVNWIRWQGAERQLQAGEYAISLQMTPAQLIQKLKKGDVVQHAITFSEGLTLQEALKLCQNHPAMQPMPTLTPEGLMVALGEPDKHPEGLFFPSTYYFSRGATPLDVLKRARKTMEYQLGKVYSTRSDRCVLQSPYEVLILASIIEKESALVSERPVISGVFQRRLSQNMLLQADPTLIYGLKDQYTGRLTSAQLKEDQPYNTYLRKGLPPTPIALPSLNAIVAACHPDEGLALYFVAKGDGSHYFSATLQAHQDAVRKYQLKDKAQ